MAKNYVDDRLTTSCIVEITFQTPVKLLSKANANGFPAFLFLHKLSSLTLSQKAVLFSLSPKINKIVGEFGLESELSWLVRLTAIALEALDILGCDSSSWTRPTDGSEIDA